MEVGENVDLNKEINLIQGDCLEKMKEIPDKSINLVLIDPPYNINKADWDKWKTVNAYVEFMGQVFLECQRVLKDNGSFYFFHNDFLQMVELQTWINKNTKFVFKSMLTWEKYQTNKQYYGKNVLMYVNATQKRNYRSMAEYCLYYTLQDETGLTKIKTDLNNFVSLREYSKKIQHKIGKKLKEINTILGHRKAEHFFYHSSTQWELCTEETYNELIKEFNIDEFEFFRKYEDLRQEYEKMRYTFNLKEVQENISCVWENNDKNSGKLHPCEKPLDILEKIIKASSNENDVVLDCFMGSGSVGVVCLNTDRRFIGIEKEEKYFNIAKERIEKASNISFF